jgi:hypothetical protein
MAKTPRKPRKTARAVTFQRDPDHLKNLHEWATDHFEWSILAHRWIRSVDAYLRKSGFKAPLTIVDPPPNPPKPYPPHFVPWHRP